MGIWDDEVFQVEYKIHIQSNDSISVMSPAASIIYIISFGFGGGIAY
jgi:hypothetical protein